jgi:enoyl-CoA hydratase/carnithine racemase
MDATASAPATDLVKLETKQGLRVLTLNRPAKMNALSVYAADLFSV